MSSTTCPIGFYQLKMMYLQLIGGFAVLLFSAEIFIRGVVSLAKILNVSPLVIGMTVVAIGTSAPELVVTLDASLSGSPGLALGNIIGSNIANVLLILGASCVLSEITGPENPNRRDSITLMAGTAVFVLLCGQGVLSFWSGGILFVAFIGFLVSSYRTESKDEAAAAEHIHEVEDMASIAAPTGVIILTVLVGMAGIIWGADLLVKGGVSIARIFGISEEIIGLTVIALGTSLPELAASVVAAYRGHSDIVVGNVVGSNLFNILGIAGVASMVTPLPVSGNILSFDLWVMLGATALVVPILTGRWHPGRGSGVAFLALYGAYIAYNGYSAGLFGGG
ncbi:MAG: Inner membrane protein YrbG [Alphaproteobacteria bacterium MarineAlpha3_Bin2]|nr:MAG: Inner membrane protein YrbG [Alphaproteobacteria bacterium MarineAlpha3_Bin1]PPR73080.1 MAG: Inner membrane protein YrbG [Alphaproteobacteria bacterium MarineAlpha3_Bin2]